MCIPREKERRDSLRSVDVPHEGVTEDSEVKAAKFCRVKGEVLEHFRAHGHVSSPGSRKGAYDEAREVEGIYEVLLTAAMTME